jgi:TolB-like protein/Tfp pilus assembly protein PilF
MGNEVKADAELPSSGDEPVRQQLARILASKAFAASARNGRFLEYIVTETLAGRGGRIKAYAIATIVFERNASFDPQTDPVVRLEASRLRRALEQYYLTAGKRDPVRISIPKGSYVPNFERVGEEGLASDATRARSDDTSAAEASPLVKPLRQRRFVAAVSIAAAALLLVAGIGLLQPGFFKRVFDSTSDAAPNAHGPAILVLPFEGAGDSTSTNLAKGLTLDVITDLTRFNDLFVYAADTSFGLGQSNSTSDLASDYKVSGRVVTTADRFVVTVSLIEARSNRYLWSEQFDGALSPDQILSAESDIADRVVRTIAQPYGVIFTDRVREIQGRPPALMNSYQCVLLFKLYWRSQNPQLFQQSHECLERVIVEDPNYSEAYASLSLVYSDSYRHGFSLNEPGGDQRRRALELAQRAVELEPNSASGYLALHLARWLLNEVDLAFEAAEAGLALNPNNTEIMAALGSRYCWRGIWDKGLPLVKQAFSRNPALSDAYRHVFVLDYYRRGEYQEALTEAKKINMPDDIYSYAALAATQARLGNTVEAHEAVARMLAIDPEFGKKVVNDFRRRNFQPDLIVMIVDGLKAAGLEVSEQPTNQ